MSTLKEYKKSLTLWDELMKDEEANAMALNVLGQDISYLVDRLREEGIDPNKQDLTDPEILASDE